MYKKEFIFSFFFKPIIYIFFYSRNCILHVCEENVVVVKFFIFMIVRVPVNVIEHDHLDVPSIVACLACSKESMWVSGSTPKVILKIYDYIYIFLKVKLSHVPSQRVMRRKRCLFFFFFRSDYIRSDDVLERSF